MQSDFWVEDDIYQTIKIHLRTFGLINLEVISSNDTSSSIRWSLTKYGDEQMMKLRNTDVFQKVRQAVTY